MHTEWEAAKLVTEPQWTVSITNFVVKALITSSLTIPTFQGEPTIFHKGIFLKKTIILRFNVL